MDYTKEKSIKLLLDSGAQMSFIKISSIVDEKKIDSNYSVKYRDVVGCTNAFTLGILESGIYLNNSFYSHEFHVVNNNATTGAAEGILGSDCLRKYKCSLDYNKNELKIVRPNLVMEEEKEKFAKRKKNGGKRKMALPMSK